MRGAVLCVAPMMLELIQLLLVVGEDASQGGGTEAVMVGRLILAFL
jgi:hypothetical protein